MPRSEMPAVTPQRRVASRSRDPIQPHLGGLHVREHGPHGVHLQLVLSINGTGSRAGLLRSRTACSGENAAEFVD